jgi:hypothetical protein
MFPSMLGGHRNNIALHGTQISALLYFCRFLRIERVLAIAVIRIQAGRSWMADRLGFDFTAHMLALCEDITTRSAEMSHIHMPSVCVTFSQARKRQRHGVQASLTPLRFEGGMLIGKRKGRTYRVQRLFGDGGNEYLYLLTFFLPRFMDLSLEEKFITIFHELWHIGPKFDGDLRRHPGRCYVHTESEREYDAEMARKACRYLQLTPPPALYQFLRVEFDALVRRHGNVFGTSVTQPKLIPVAA